MTANLACKTLQLLGQVGKATDVAEGAFRQARSSQHLFTLCHALVEAGMFLSLLKREPRKILQYAEEVIALSGQNGFAEWSPFGEFFSGCALADLGEVEKGVAGMEKGVESLKRLDPSVWPLLLAQLASGYARLGKIDRAVAMIEGILAQVDRSGLFGDKAEILRIKGEVLRRADCPAENQAERCFRSAIDIAQTQEAKWWELRATTSLARLLRDNGRRDEARAILAEIYGWFAEGFDTADLKDAKALLEELKT